MENKSISNFIEERLKQLEKEKQEIEQMYGVNEKILEDFMNSSEKYKPIKVSSKASTQMKQTKYESLPKLDNLTKHKEMNKSYQTPNAIKESLKYEPSILDLCDKAEFEPSYYTVKPYKLKPQIPKGHNITKHIDHLNEEYNDEYIL